MAVDREILRRVVNYRITGHIDINEVDWMYGWERN